MSIQVGLQLYTLRKEMKRDFFGTLEKVAEMGYQGVEFVDFGGFPAATLKEKLAELKLVPVGAAFIAEDFRTKFEEILEYVKTLGCGYLTCVWERYGSKEDYIQAAAFYNEIGRKCRENGITFCYHNHAFEFLTYDGEYALDLLYRLTDPENMKAEIDTCFVEMMGLNPAAYMRKYASRCPLLHLKDWERGTTSGTVEVGNGVLDIPEIVTAAGEIGVEWMIVEQEYFINSAVESARESLDNLRRMNLL